MLRGDDIEKWLGEQMGKTSFSMKIDRLWKELRHSAEKAGYGLEDITALITQVRRERREGKESKLARRLIALWQVTEKESRESGGQKGKG
jgi:hypothetical protein